MDSHRVVSNWDLSRVLMPDTALELGRLHMHMVGCVYAWNFGTKFFLRRGECKTWENSNFLKKGKIVNSIKIRNFSRSRMTKRTFPLKSSHEIELPRRISLDSEVIGISRFSRRGMSDDTWQGKEMPYGTIRE